MLKRLKFRVYGGAATGKYVYSLKEGCEVFLNLQFQPSLTQNADTRTFLQVTDGRTMLFFIKPGLCWNGTPVDRGSVELHPGHLVGSPDCIVEILECPEAVEEDSKEHTKYLDLSALQKIDAGFPEELGPAKGSVPKVTLTPLPDGVLPQTEDQEATCVTKEIYAPAQKRSGAWASAAAISFSLVAAVVIVKGRGWAEHFQNHYSPPAVSPAPAPALEVVAQSAPAEAVPETTPAPSLPAAPVKSEKEELLIRAIAANDLEALRKSFEVSNADPVLAIDERGRPPALQAAALGRLTVLKYLISKNVDTAAVDEAGNNALMWAVQEGREKTVRFLLAQGADPGAKRKDGSDAIKLAADKGDRNLQKILNDAASGRMPASAGSP